MRKDFVSTLRHGTLIKAGVAALIFANPFLYLVIGVTFIDIQNLFGANINRQLVSYSTDDPFIQTMNLVSSVGAILVLIGVLLHARLKRTVSKKKQ